MGENRHLFIEHQFGNLFNKGCRQVWVGMNSSHVGIDIRNLWKTQVTAKPSAASLRFPWNAVYSTCAPTNTAGSRATDVKVVSKEYKVGVLLLILSKGSNALITNKLFIFTTAPTKEN